MVTYDNTGYILWKEKCLQGLLERTATTKSAANYECVQIALQILRSTYTVHAFVY